MKTISQLQLTRALRLRGTFLAVVAGCLAAGLAATHAAPPSLQPLLQGKWPKWSRGAEAQDVKVVSNPTNCVQVGGCETSGQALGVAVSGNYPDLADWRVKATIFNRCPRANPSTSRGRFAKGLVVQT